MDPQGAAVAIAINVLSNFLADLLKGVGGSRSSPIEVAITTTVEKFPGIEGLRVTLEQWLQSPGVRSAVEEYAKGLKGFDPVRVDALSESLLQNTQFFLPDGDQQAAHEIVVRFFSEIREQYLSIPELGIPHVANRLEEEISISAAGFESLKSEVRGLARDSLDQQIDEARDRLQRHEHEVARGICEKLRQGSWDRLDARQRFRVLSNLATVSLLQESLNEAAGLFIEAKRFQPEDPVALANEALAYLLLRDNERAFELATGARERFPTSARALMVWLDTAPATLTMQNLEAAVPPYLSEDAEVMMALARRSLAARDTLKAEGLARRAIAIKEDWSYPWSLLGESIFRSELPSSAEDYARAVPLCDAFRLAAAVEACTKAIQLAQKEKVAGVEAGSLLIRAEARRLLGEADADEDVVTAYSLHPNDPTVLRDYAYMKLRRGQMREAIEKLRPGLTRHDRVDLRMVLAAALSVTGEQQDRDEATEILVSMVADRRKIPAELRTHAAVSAIDNLVRDQRFDQAGAFLSQLPADSLSATALATLRGRVELTSGHRGKAAEMGSDAIAGITASTSNDDIRLTAKFLEELGRHRDALPLWQRLASPGSLGYDTCRLIDCAMRLGEHRLFLNLCEQLRLNGVYDPQLIEEEAAIRERYDVEGTISLLQEHLRRSPEDRGARLQLSVIGIQLGRDELVSSDPASMPAADETAAENWKTIVLVLRTGGHLWDALRFAYRLLRLNFGKIEAHRAYIALLLTTDPLPEIPTPEVVGPATAVAFTEEGATQIEWRIIEEEFEPDENLQEIGPSHFIAQQLAGKRVGDTFLVAQGSVVSKRATVLQILSKYVYRFQDCGLNWLRRFPNQPDIQSVRVAVPRPGGGEKFDFTEFFQSFDRILASHHEAIGQYRNLPITIHRLAEALGRGDLEQTIRLAGDDSLPVRCCAGNAEERSGAILAVKNASAVVLDITAISTLALLDAIDLLPQFHTQFLVSEQTLSEIRWLAEEHAAERGRTGFGRDGYRYVMTEMTAEAVRDEREYFDLLAAKVKSSCTVVACAELAAVPSEKREFLTKAVGDHGAQSIVLASVPGHVLWTDDYGVALLAAHEFGVRRVWTQVALQERVEAAAIKAELFIEATAKLLGWRYYFTSTGAPALTRAGSIAAWNPDRWPLKGALEVFSDRAISTKDALSLAISFMLQYVSEIVLPEVRDTVTVRILERLSSRGEGLSPIGALLRALPGAFGLNVLRATELTRIANAWLVTRLAVRGDV